MFVEEIFVADTIRPHHCYQALALVGYRYAQPCPSGLVLRTLSRLASRVFASSICNFFRSFYEAFI